MNKPKRGSLQAKVRAVLEDGNWHCRSHEYKRIPSGQLAGGGGIQGLQRGTSARPGLKIESKTDLCEHCGRKTRWDRWTGEHQTANAPASIPKALAEKVLAHFGNVDSIEQRVRPVHELVIDHRFPMIRWGATETKLSGEMSEADIEQKFQLLKFDGSGNHNLLKSRACEVCFKTGQRGTPFGIRFFYEGNDRWPGHTPASGTQAEKGCIGCGWYDFAKWREALNLKLAAPSAATLP
ncbi:MAG: putative restriction endonuclease [Limisphaerales bacterium]|nr:MAG: putative restriction endonuclease [Limisphaerales bacterium]KAG0506749.1 MAG: putative restriction endonuclease [Limisphaerales bacterium]TXT46034.1 MAG: putative restriction endonuclease [Limisphaerales bacterium]